MRLLVLQTICIAVRSAGKAFHSIAKPMSTSIDSSDYRCEQRTRSLQHNIVRICLSNLVLAIVEKTGNITCELSTDDVCMVSVFYNKVS